MTLGPRRARLAPLLAALLVGTLVAGCSSSASPGSGSTSVSPKPLPSDEPSASATPEPDLSRFYDQQLAWRPCGKGNQCSRLEVPLDYADPTGETTDLALLRHRAEGTRQQRVGSLVVNPGGPGGSGVEYASGAARAFSATVRNAYDIVGFDPRGVGQSDPVDCLSDSALDTFVASDPDPDTPAEEAEGARLLREFGQGCLQRSGDLARHISTQEAARDVDVLRAALGEQRLAWFGASYGTFLGATYAELFPQRVGRMVLDGAIDPAVGNVEMSLVQARGFETATQAYLKHCVGTGSCPLGDTVDAAEKGLQDLLAKVDAQPLPGVGDRRLEVGNAVLGVWVALYSKSYWTYLDQALEAAERGDGSILLMLSDAYVGRGQDGYRDNSTEALLAINCLDHDGGIPESQVKDYVPRFEKVSPTWGRIFAYGLVSCEDWPIHTGRKPEAIHAPGAAPILVVGTSRDPATPLRWAKALAAQLDSGVLVTRNGDGHTGYLAGNQCVDRTVDRYLVGGVVPKGTVHC